MLPFSVTLVAGESPYKQVVFAATRAVVSGVLAAGDAFPSVRELSQALKINPNTAHKVVQELIRDGVLEVRPGIGTVVAAGRRAPAAERRQLLSEQVEALVVEAMRVGIARDEVLDAVRSRWAALAGDAGTRRAAKQLAHK
ncbi:MAG: GntR family transcriptional regulator [Gemmatimonadaceae bacterium]|nr:GntR family transcriptional regulator [Gemmatimonadaceae bacterium]